MTAADREMAEALVERLNRGGASLADVETAEGLVARNPTEAGLAEVLEATLLSVAETERAGRRHAEAAVLLRRAATARPASPRPHLALAVTLVEAGDPSGAEAAARAALDLEPRSAAGLEALAYALWRQDRNREAVDALRTALGIRDSPGARTLLARIEKGMVDEKGMREQQLSHFHVRYDGEAHEDVGREILRALERHHATLVRTLDHQPGVTIPVILFSREGYYTASGAPAWSGGVYDGLDGRIRVPIGGLSNRLTPDMDATLVHELTHAFVADRSRGVAPRDLHEGLAQRMEGKRQDQLDGPTLRALADGRIPGTAGFYLSALSFVEYLAALRGQGGLNDLVRAMGETGDVDGAYRSVYGQAPDALRKAWRDRLRQQHGS